MATTEDRTAAEVAQDYFGSIRQGDTSPQQRAYAEDAVGSISGLFADQGKREIVGFFTALYAAFPDFRFEVVDIVGEDDVAACHWRATGTFAGPGSFEGLAPTGARVALSGVDVIRVRDGLIVRNDAYTDSTTLMRQLGVLPAADSPAQARMTRALNLRTRAARSTTSGAEPIADDVWIVRGGFPAKTMNVFLVRDGDGVLLFDAGIRSMTDGVAAAGAQLGGITRVVLGHGHADHRGVAPSLGVPVLCHADEVAMAESVDGGDASFDYGLLNPLARRVMPRLIRLWDGGPVTIAGTVAEGEEIAGFRVVALPGHSPGLIGLWRERDRLALVSDCFYTLDPQTGIHGAPRVPLAAFNTDTEQARTSMRKLASLRPAAAWPGHAEPLTGDVATQLDRAAATT